MPRSGSRKPRQRPQPVLRLPEEQWLQLKAVLNQLSTIDGSDSIAADDFGIALELCQIDESAASVRSLTKKCLTEDGRVDYLTFLKESQAAKCESETKEPEPEPEPELELEPEPEASFSPRRSSSRTRRAIEHPSPLTRERSLTTDAYQPGDFVEYNSVTLGGWACAVVGEVYPNGELLLLGDPGPGATAEQIAAAKGHILKDGASVARVRRRKKASTKRGGGLTAYSIEDFHLGEEIAAGASCKVMRGEIRLDGETIPLAVKDFVWNAHAAEDSAHEDGRSEYASDDDDGGLDLRITSGNAMAMRLKDEAAKARKNPKWLADRDHPTCMLGSKCQHASFSLINKVHHCRYCGWVVCGNCRRQELEVDRWVSSDTHGVKSLEPPATKLKAVCDSCFEHAPREIRMRAERKKNEQTDDFANVRQKMRDEAEILHRCAHPNVVKVIGVCYTRPSLCLLLEWCPLGSLYDALRNERIAHSSHGEHEASSSTVSLPRLDTTRLGYAKDVARALAYLHGPSGGSIGRRGWAVAHRDVKSQNYLVAADGTVKLADLGDAQLVSNTTTSVAGLLSGGGGDSAMSPSDVMAAARTSAKAVGSAMVNLTAAVHREAAALAGGIMAMSGLGLNLESEDGIDSVTAGTPEWMAPELLATTMPPSWFEPDDKGSYIVDKQVPGLRQAMAEWPRSNWEIEDFCRGDVYGMGIVLWEIYTAAEPGSRGTRLQHIRAVCVDNRRPDLPSRNSSTNVAGRGRAAREAQSNAEEYESWVQKCWHERPGARPTAEEVLQGLEYVAESVELAAANFVE